MRATTVTMSVRFDHKRLLHEQSSVHRRAVTRPGRQPYRKRAVDRAVRVRHGAAKAAELRNDTVGSYRCSTYFRLCSAVDDFRLCRVIRAPQWGALARPRTAFEGDDEA